MSHNSLESILDFRNKHPLYHEFIIYLQQSYCLENVLFYQEVQDYRSKPTYKKYQTILHKYILVNAPHEINIPCEMRQALMMNEKSEPSSFDEAAESILELIRVNSYMPWYFQRNHSKCSRRNTLTPSLSVPEHRWQGLFSTSSRPSFASLRDVDIFTPQQEKKIGLFQRKKKAILGPC